MEEKMSIEIDEKKATDKKQGSVDVTLAGKKALGRRVFAQERN